jgi:hypothetical protein
MYKSFLVFIFFIFTFNSIYSQVLKVQFPIGHPEGIRFIKHTQDGKYIFSVSFNDLFIRVWETTNTRLVSVIPTEGVQSIVVSPDNHTVFVISDKGSFLWDFYSETEIMKITETVVNGAFRDDGSKLIYYNSKSIYQIDIESKKEISVKTFEDSIDHVEFLNYTDNLITVFRNEKELNFKNVNLDSGIDSLFFQSENILGYSLDSYNNDCLLFLFKSKKNYVFKIDGKTFQTKMKWNYKPEGKKSVRTTQFYEPTGIYSILYNDLTRETFEVVNGNIQFYELSYLPDQILVLNQGKTIIEKDGQGLVLLDTDSLNIQQFINADLTANIKNVPAGTVVDELNNRVYCAFSDNFIRSYSFNNDTLVLENIFVGKTLNIGSLKIKNEQMHFVDGNCDLKKFDLNTGELKSVLKLSQPGYIDYKVNEEINRAISISWDSLLIIWDYEEGLALDTFKLNSELNTISMKGDKLAIIGTPMIRNDRDRSEVLLLEVVNGKVLNSMQIKENINSFELCNDGKNLLISYPEKKIVELWDLQFNLIKTLKIDEGWILDADEVPNLNSYIVVTSEASYFFDQNSFELIRTLPNPIDNDSYWNVSPSGKFLCNNSTTGSIVMWDLNSNKKIGSYNLHEGLIEPVFISDSALVTFSNDGTIKRWLFIGTSFHLKYTIIPFENKEFAFVNPQGYYFSTKEAAKNLHYMADNLKVISFEQLDIHFNRPDLVLKSMGSTDTSLISSYRNAYEKRVKKLSIDTSMFSINSYPSELTILNADKLQNENKENIDLCFIAQIANNKFESFNIWINEVPIYGKNGQKFNGTSIDTCINVLLSPGKNRIEVAVKNSNAIESFRSPLYVNYTPEKSYTSKTHFIGIGIDKFKEDGHDLSYSVKDVRDLSKALKGKLGDQLTIDTLFNQNVNVSNVQALKKKLLQTNINDKVIISYSGHGLLNEEYDYFLSAYNVEFLHPENGGIPYEVLEDLLDSIPARQKLLLIDACHSGEVDKDDFREMAAVAGAKGMVKPKGGGAENTSASNTVGLQNSFQLMQELFVNVQKGSGATIISAAAGDQFALEGGKLENGFFTYAILKYMAEQEDASVNALKKYVYTEVEKLSGGLQKPTSRIENLEIDWKVW